MYEFIIISLKECRLGLAYVTCGNRELNMAVNGIDIQLRLYFVCRYFSPF